MSTGARNPKEVRVVANITSDLNIRIEALADAMAQNKGTAVASCIAAGLIYLEEVYHTTKNRFVPPAGLDERQAIDDYERFSTVQDEIKALPIQK